jgi:hypothetical protein
MRGLLDDEALSGAHEAAIVYRPERVGLPVTRGDNDKFIKTVEYQCQLWGGATAPIIPVEPDGAIHAVYRRKVGDASIDRIAGLPAYGLFRVNDVSIETTPTRQGYGSQLL